jgi:autotransporter-associated beta strand protein
MEPEAGSRKPEAGSAERGAGSGERGAGSGEREHEQEHEQEQESEAGTHEPRKRGDELVTGHWSPIAGRARLPQTAAPWGRPGDGGRKRVALMGMASRKRTTIRAIRPCRLQQFAASLPIATVCSRTILATKLPHPIIPMKSLRASSPPTGLLRGFRLAVGLALLVVGAAFHAQAAPITWNGSTNIAWSDGGNWDGGNPPTNDTTTDTAVFNATFTNQPGNVGTTGVAGIEVGSNSTAALTIGNATNGHTLSIGAGGITIASGANTVNLNVNSTLTIAQEWRNEDDSTFTVSRPVNNGGFLLTINTTQSLSTKTIRRMVINGNITGAGGLTKVGPGRLRLQVSQGYTGVTTISGGEISLGTGGATSFASAFNLDTSGARLAIDDAGDSLSVVGIDGVAGTVVANNNNSGRTLTINTASSTSYTLSGNVINSSGALFLVKSGAGTQILAGSSNTYTGNTAVNTNGGTLLVNGIIAASATANFTVNANATLGGNGTINRATIVSGNASAEAVLKPGASPGTLEIGGNLTLGTLGNRTRLTLEIGGNTPGDAASNYSQVNVTGAANGISLADQTRLTLNFAAYAPSTSDVFWLLNREDAGGYVNPFAQITIIDGNGTGNYTGDALGNLTNLTINGSSAWRLSYTGNWTGSQGTSSISGGNDLVLYAIPEPSAVLMMLGGFGILALFRSRSRG